MAEKKTHTSAEVKNRYNTKAYDRLGVMVYKGGKEKLKERADELDMSVNAYINMLISKDIEGFVPMK